MCTNAYNINVLIHLIDSKYCTYSYALVYYVTLHNGVVFGGMYVCSVVVRLCNFTLALNCHFGMGLCTL